MSLTILFLHGWHSVVGGVKPTHLAQAGHRVLNPALDDDDFALALRTAQAEFDRHSPHVIVGSFARGRGGTQPAERYDSACTPLPRLEKMGHG